VRKSFLPAILFLLIFIFTPKQVFAFSSASDTISTSRPSASTPLTAIVNTGDTVLTVTAGGTNLSTFLASDAAKLWGGTVESLNIASASADRTKIYTTNAAAYTHNIGTLVTHAVTAKHTISFQFSTPGVSGDQLVITFPGVGDNSDAPSATTFAFNGLNGSAGTNITVSGATCSSWNVSAPSITCTLGGAVSAGTTVTVTIGSSTPQLINPTKTNSIGTSDLWKLTLNHLDNAGAAKENEGRIAIATIEGVKVTGVVDASITMTIAPINNGTNIYTDNNSCNNAAFSPIVTNSGADPSATSVNLGTIGLSINYVAQKITISTNGSGGYVLTATASGKLMNHQSGYSFQNAQGGTSLVADNLPAPAIISASAEAYGISACGTHANSIFWSGANALFGNPNNSAGNAFIYKLASWSTPVTNAITSVIYGVTSSGTTPAGTYETAINYIATPTF
jgi:hypothetical protein